MTHLPGQEEQPRRGAFQKGMRHPICLSGGRIAPRDIQPTKRVVVLWRPLGLRMPRNRQRRHLRIGGVPALPAFRRRPRASPVTTMSITNHPDSSTSPTSPYLPRGDDQAVVLIAGNHRSYRAVALPAMTMRVQSAAHIPLGRHHHRTSMVAARRPTTIGAFRRSPPPDSTSLRATNRTNSLGSPNQSLLTVMSSNDLTMPPSECPPPCVFVDLPHGPGWCPRCCSLSKLGSLSTGKRGNACHTRLRLASFEFSLTQQPSRITRQDTCPKPGPFAVHTA